MSRDLVTERLERRVISMRAANARARATDACTHVRKAMEILEPAATEPQLQHLLDLLDEAATILIAELGKEVT